MIRTFGRHEVYVGVLSSGRPHKAHAMQEIVGLATWHVPPYERGAYGQSVVTGPGCGYNVALARNRVLDAAGDRTCLMLDDELHPKIVGLNEDGTAHAITFETAAEVLLDRLEESGLGMAATSHVTNLMFARNSPPVKTRITIQGGCWAVRPTPIRFDPLLRYNEEWDFVIKQWQAHGGALRVNDLLLRFGRGTPGGVQDYMDTEERQRCADLLVARYPTILRPTADASVKLIPRRGA